DFDDWENDDDSGWDEDDGNSAHLEQKKRGPYLTGKTKKSTYFDKYRP
ncbi:17803_t:CDS:2, partial [Funneliformis geosporum]